MTPSFDQDEAVFAAQPLKSFWVIAPFFPRKDSDPLVGGFINNPARLWSRMAKDGHAVTVFTYGRAKGEWAFNGVRVISVGPLLFKGAASIFYLEVKLLCAFVKEGLCTTKGIAQIRVHHVGGLSLLVLRKLGLIAAPLVVTAHGTSLPEEAANAKALINSVKRSAIVQFSRWIQYLFDKALFQGADALVSPSHFQVKELVELYGVKLEKIVVIPNGYDEKNFHRDVQGAIRIRKLLNFTQEDALVLMVARATPKKGVAQFIEAARINQKQTKVRYVCIIGDPLHRKTEIDVAELERCAPPNCLVLRNIPEDQLPSFYSAAKLCVFPSIGYESVPSVIYEACACGADILTSRLSGTQEVINGFFLESTAPEEIAAKIVDLLTNPFATRFRQDYSLTALIPLHRDFCCPVLAEKP